jgi:cobaltochelatase CobS
MMNKVERDIPALPDTTVNVRKLFGSMCRTSIPDYLFDRDTTLAILAGFAFNRRVMVSGYHGTGKSTHIEQVAARLNWPCVRVNLDSHVSRIDLVGKDAIVVKDGKQVTEFRDGILPWAYQHNVALVFDEYDAGRPDVMFVIQRVLESSGRLTLLDQKPRHPPASGLPPVRHRQHGRPRRYDRPLSRHPADQPGADGPLVDRHHAELPAARQRSRHRAGQGQALPNDKGRDIVNKMVRVADLTAPPSSTATCRP